MAASISSIAIIGAGHGGCAAAADLTRRGFAVRLYGRSASTIAPIQAAGGITLGGSLGEGFVPLPCVTSDAAAAMAGAELILMMGPTHAHAAMAETIAPHLHAGQVLLAAPGHTVLLIPGVLRRHGKAAVPFCDTATLPYIARKSGPAAVQVTQAARRLPFAAFPGRRTAELAERLQPVFPALAPHRHLLETVFPYTNAIHHPPATLCNAGRIEATGGDYCHYYDGISPAVGRIIDRLDRERCAIGAAFGIEVLPFVEHFHRIGYTTAAARDSGLAYEAFHQSEPDRWIRAPASLDHRFLDEDIPYGLVLLAALAGLSGVAAPTVEHLIHLGCLATGKDYRAQGLSLERIGLAGLDAAAAVRLLEEGYADAA
ncbi:NAD/NADP-dependent octopine/nopaline dehydrogenase family protein [Siccirubricoccus phaeus]|uniref:NAD/NADP-dependent octopine/nopaline dehydrogenase family protein n=1 Tax=Siccirubricoccus phaeus TaxID=2595053 RepID=UPI0011F0DBD8|nr:NAD/NADP octopine/nopaline dehydrogenase family protein [Siccirubricoccus phaeus]